MKRITALLLCLLLVFTLCACDSSNGNNNNSNNADKDPITVTVTTNGDIHMVEMSRMPECADDLKAFDITDEFQASAALICTLANFEENYDNALEMLDVVMGPESPSAYDESFIKNQLDQYPYVMRSYFDGATPENDYTYDSVTLVILESLYSRTEDGYVKLWVFSSGADSERGFTLRQKASTSEWFLFSDTYKGLMAGIKEPKSNDAWA